MLTCVEMHRWSNALMNFKYGKNFTYHEMVARPNQGYFTAAFISVFTYLSILFIKIRPLRSLLFAIGVLPRPGKLRATVTRRLLRRLS